MATPLTWQQVASPDFRGVTGLLGLSNEALNRGFGTLSEALGKFDNYSKDVRLSNILNETTAITDPAQLRTVVAGADRSGLGSAQLAALEAAITGRINQAGALEQLSFDQKNNPLRLDNQTNINKAQVQKYNHDELYLPLVRQKTSAEIGQIGAQTASTMEQTRGAAARNREFIATSPERIAQERNKTTQSDRGVRLGQDEDAAAAAVARVNTNANTPADVEIALAADTSLTNNQRAIAQSMLRQTWGAYGPNAGAAPQGSGGGGGGRQAASAPAPGSTSSGPLPYVPGQNDGSEDVNAGQRQTAAVSGAASRALAAQNAATGGLGLANAMTDTTPKQNVITSDFGKGTTFEKIDPRYVDAALTDIMKEARSMGVTLTPKAAAELYAQNHTFSNDTFSNDRSSWFSWDPSNNRPTYNKDTVRATLERMKARDFTDQVRANNQVLTGVKQVEQAQKDWTKAGAALQAAVSAARRTPGQGDTPLVTRRREEYDAARARRDRILQKFSQENPDYVPQRQGATQDQRGLPRAPEDTLANAPAPAVAPAAGAATPAAAALGAAATPQVPPALQQEMDARRAIAEQAMAREQAQRARQAEAERVQADTRLQRAQQDIWFKYGGSARTIPDAELRAIARQYGISVETLKGSLSPR